MVKSKSQMYLVSLDALLADKSFQRSKGISDSWLCSRAVGGDDEVKATRDNSWVDGGSSPCFDLAVSSGTIVFKFEKWHESRLYC